MSSEILVFGHRNPDTDSIASAIGYAWLAGRTLGEGYVPARLGEPNRETSWVLERFGLEPPRLVEHVRMTAADAMNPDVSTATSQTTMEEVGAAILEHGYRAVPIVDEGRVVGIVGQGSLARRYLEESEVAGFATHPTTVAKLAAAVGGAVMLGDGERQIAGRVLIGAMEPSTMARYLSEGDVLIIGDRLRSQRLAVEAGVGCLILTGGARPEPDVEAQAGRDGIAIVVTDHDTYGAARRINLSIPAGALMDRDPLLVGPDELLADVTADLIASAHREALVCDESGALLGLISRTDLARAGRKQVVLVDHSESSQSAEGIREARVVAILDHHRLGDVESAEPITVIARPVGATSSIVAALAHDAAETPPPAVAGALLAAVLSDTIILRSPTTTGLDREMAAWLGEVVGVDPEAFGMEMMRARADEESFDPDAIVRGDLKVYNFGGQKVAISQLETIDGDGAVTHGTELRAALERIVTEQEADLAVLMVTDVVREGSVLLSAGRTRALERAFDLAEGEERFLPGVLSRKKQVAAVLARSLGGP